MAINVVLVGVGFMGKLTARYLAEKNYAIAGVIARTSHVGEDLGVVAGLPAPLGVTVSTSLDEVLRSGDVDIAVVTTSSDMASLVEVAEPCLRAGVNVVTISEAAFHARSAGEAGARLDALAKEHGATVLATGVQDIFWLNSPAMMTGACQRIDGIYGVSSVNLDVYGPALVSQYPLDLSPAEYEEHAARAGKNSDLIPFSGIALEALAEKMGLTPTHRTTRHEPIYDSVDIRSESLGRTIAAGRTCGVTEIYDIETAQGIALKVQFVEKLNRPDETQAIRWEIKGEPDLSIVVDNFPGEAVTCATLVNRIPDVIAAAPGFLTSGDLPPASFKGEAA
jgi:4-hydroxy-tetrahydrodipicolinate reductase